MNIQEQRDGIKASLLRARHQYERAAAGAANQESGAKEKLVEARDLVASLESELNDLDAAESYLAEEAVKDELAAKAKEKKIATKEIGSILRKRKSAFSEIVQLIVLLGEQIELFHATRDEAIRALEPFQPATREEFSRRMGNPTDIRNKLESFMWLNGVRLRPSSFGVREVSNLDFDKFLDQLNENALRVVAEE